MQWPARCFHTAELSFKIKTIVHTNCSTSTKTLSALFVRSFRNAACSGDRETALSLSDIQDLSPNICGQPNDDFTSPENIRFHEPFIFSHPLITSSTGGATARSTASLLDVCRTRYYMVPYIYPGVEFNSHELWAQKRDLPSIKCEEDLF